MRRVWWLAAMGAVLAACSSAAAPPPPFKPVLDTRGLMVSVIDPNADVIWEAVKTIITRAGVEEIRPKSDEEWAAIRNAAATVAEAGNLLMLTPRARDSDEWMRASQALIETGTSAMRAAEDKNADQLFTVGGEMYSACTNCHQKYMGS
jgi:hypothetical protein